MRTIIRSTGQLAELRAALLRDVVVPDDARVTVDGFVAAVHEVVAAAVGDGTTAEASIDVRWRRRLTPRVELCAEVRIMGGTPPSLTDDGIASLVLHRSVERVDVEERIGGSVITVRSRV